MRPQPPALLAFSGALWCSLVPSGALSTGPLSTGAISHQAPVVTEQHSNTTAMLIAASAVNDTVVWASGARGTFVRTVDGGTTWVSGRVPGADRLQFRDVH